MLRIGLAVKQTYLLPLPVYECILLLELPFCCFRLMNGLVYFFLIRILRIYFY